MTNKQTAKRSLLAAILSLVLCLALFAGTTFAWFTDSISNTKNKILAGNLDIEMQYFDTEANAWVEFNADSDILSPDALWEPGYTEVVYLKVTNTGTLALKYQLGVSVFNEITSINTAGEPFALSDYIKFAAIADKNAEEGTFATREDALAAVADTATPISEGYSSSSALMKAGESAYVALVVYMPTEVGNAANYKTGAARPEITLGVTLMASQTELEGDGFGTDYDKTADVDAMYTTAGEYEINETIVLIGSATDVITAAGTGVTVNVQGGYYDVASMDCAIWAKDGAVVNVYGGTFICDGFDGANPADHQDMIYAGTNGTINIYGGTFISRDDAWLLNEKDNSGVINVYGGTYYNWNPADNISEGVNTNFLAAGYSCIVSTELDNTIYTVLKGEVAADVADLGTKLAAGGDVILADDVTLGAAERPVMNGGTFNGNGNTITYNGGLISNGSGQMSAPVLTTTGGNISNVTIVAPQGRALYMTNLTEDLYVKDCVLDGSYSLNYNSAVETAYSINFENVVFKSWCSYANVVAAANFTNCTFEANLRPYGGATLTGCAIDGTLDLSCLEAGEVITLTDCTANGAALTAEIIENWNAGTSLNITVDGTTIVVTRA